MFNRAKQFNFLKISVLPILGILLSVLLAKVSIAQFQDVGESGFFSVDNLDKSYIQKHHISGVFIQNRIKKSGEKIIDANHSIRINYNIDGNKTRVVEIFEGMTTTSIYSYEGLRLTRIQTKITGKQSEEVLEIHQYPALNQEIIQEIREDHAIIKHLYYDSGRLIKEQRKGGAILYEYEFDSIGNCIRQTGQSANGKSTNETIWTRLDSKISRIQINNSRELELDYLFTYNNQNLISRVDLTAGTTIKHAFEFFYTKSGTLESALFSDEAHPLQFTITNYSYEFY